MTDDEIKTRLALVEKLTNSTYEKANQYDNAVVGVGYVGFFALWTGICHDIPRWSALATASLITTSLTGFITWTIVQMLGRHYATTYVNSLLSSDDERDLTFAQRWEEAEATTSRRATRIIRFWSPTFYFSLATGLLGAALLAVMAADVTIEKLSVSDATTAGPATLRSRDQILAQCKLTGEPLYIARPTDEVAATVHLTNCMRVAGYALVESKTGQSAKTRRERICFGDWDQAHWKAECYQSAERDTTLGR